MTKCHVIFAFETGINRSDLAVLESHLVYSLDKEKAFARLYLVESTKLVNEDFVIPICDVIERLVHFSTYSSPCFRKLYTQNKSKPLVKCESCYQC